MKKIVLPVILLGSLSGVYGQSDSLKIENITEVIINHTKKYKNAKYRYVLTVYF